jgi:hypothetical protein
MRATRRHGCSLNAPIGILANGWGEGLRHLLGRYGISPPSSIRDSLLNNPGRDLVTSRCSSWLGGLSVLMPSPRSGEDRGLRRRGGVLVAFMRLEKELSALPGTGVRLRLDRGPGVLRLGRVCRRAPRGQVRSLSTSTSVLMGIYEVAGDATILLRRTSNEQPAMIRCPHGRGRSSSSPFTRTGATAVRSDDCRRIWFRTWCPTQLRDLTRSSISRSDAVLLAPLVVTTQDRCRSSAPRSAGTRSGRGDGRTAGPCAGRI